ncbi:MAG: hypothetical protein ACREFX_11140 [Opitutaceae bacterium]
MNAIPKKISLKSCLQRSFPLFVSAVLFAGCQHTYTPTSRIPMEPIPEFTASGSIELNNGQPSERKVVFMKNMGTSFATSLRACTAAAIKTTKRELEKRGMSVTKGAPKSLTLSVNSVDTQVGAVKIETQLVLEVTAGNGYSSQYVARNNSVMMANVSRQVDGAIMRGVKAMLEDPKIVDYLVK